MSDQEEAMAENVDIMGLFQDPTVPRRVMRPVPDAAVYVDQADTTRASIWINNVRLDVTLPAEYDRDGFLSNLICK